MTYISQNYMTSADAPVGKYTCAPTSGLPPCEQAPRGEDTKGVKLCGQCVSYVKKVCPALPETGHWKKGSPVKGNKKMLPGTVIATFNGEKYEGHAAIYVSQNPAGINVYDQYITPPTPKPVGPRLLRWGAHGRSNNGDNFYVVD